jgi:hypothetical protein
VPPGAAFGLPLAHPNRAGVLSLAGSVPPTHARYSRHNMTSAEAVRITDSPPTEYTRRSGICVPRYATLPSHSIREMGQKFGTDLAENGNDSPSDRAPSDGKHR